ncbi:MAG: hypothetical protein SA339_07010 [Methanomassiliicoccus sp.]|nr:hypothetical protein [Methanomassiliicoccus sp.]
MADYAIVDRETSGILGCFETVVGLPYSVPLSCPFPFGIVLSPAIPAPSLAAIDAQGWPEHKEKTVEDSIGTGPI